MPPSNIILESEDNRKLNIPIYNLLVASYDPNNDNNNLKNLKIKEDCLNNISIYKDGNCFFRSISTFFSNSEEYHLFFRNLIYDYIRVNFDELISEFPYIYYNGKSIDLDDYIPLIKINGTYAGEFECNIISKMFNINILLLQYTTDDNTNENYYSYITYFGKLEENSYRPLCILEFQQNNKHFEPLFFDNNYKDINILYEVKGFTNEQPENIQKKCESKNEIKAKKIIENIIKVSKNKDSCLNMLENNVIEDITNLSLDKINENIRKNEENNIKINNISITNDNKIYDISEIKKQITRDIINHLNNFLKNENLSINNNDLNNLNYDLIHFGNDYPYYPLSYVSPEEFYADIYYRI